jgi:hypothetical protein
MTDFADSSTMSSDSTTLDTGAAGTSAAGGGAPTKLPEAEPSLHESIAAAVKEATAPGDKAEAKPEPKQEAAEKPDKAAQPAEAKDDKKPAERGPDGKFAGKEKPSEEGEAAKGEAKDGDGGTTVKGDEQPPKADAKPEAKANGHIEPPAKFLPDAKETWRNTPRPVQRDVENMAREHEAEVTRYREAAERYEPLRQFDDIVRQNGRAGLHETLAEVSQLEDLMASNPLAGLNQILLRAGPRKADGQPVSLFEVAQHIVSMGQQGYQQAVSRQPQQQQPQNDNPEVAQLKQQMAQMQQQHLAATVIEPFKRDHPRYDELQDAIASFLKSDMIPRTLSPSDRLAAAYDMAERINPPSNAAPQDKTDPEPGSRAGETFSDSTSIKSTPGAITPDVEPERGGSIEEELRRALKRQRALG